MSYVKIVLSGVAGVLLALIGPGLVVAIRAAFEEKATGFAIVLGGFSKALVLPRFWILAFLFSALLWAASRLKSTPLRALLFWTPTTFIVALGATLTALVMYMRFRSP